MSHNSGRRARRITGSRIRKNAGCRPPTRILANAATEGWDIEKTMTFSQSSGGAPVTPGVGAQLPPRPAFVPQLLSVEPVRPAASPGLLFEPALEDSTAVLSPPDRTGEDIILLVPSAEPRFRSASAAPLPRWLRIGPQRDENLAGKASNTPPSDRKESIPAPEKGAVNPRVANLVDQIATLTLIETSELIQLLKVSFDLI